MVGILLMFFIPYLVPRDILLARKKYKHSSIEKANDVVEDELKASIESGVFSLQCSHSSNIDLLEDKTFINSFKDEQNGSEYKIIYDHCDVGSYNSPNIQRLSLIHTLPHYGSQKYIQSPGFNIREQ